MIIINKPTPKEVRLLPDVNKIIYKSASTLNALPGDTIILKGLYQSFYLKDLNGTPDNPINIIAEDLVTIGGYKAYAMILENSSYVNVIAASSRGGLVIDGGETGNKSPGIALNKCHHIDIYGFESITNVSVGIMAKTTPKSDAPGTYETATDQFSYESINISKCNIHDITGEGVYIGCSTSDLMPITINGVATQVYAYRVKNLTISDCSFKNTGWDGIQVTCGDGVLLQRNKIDKYGLAGVGFQKYGIICAANNATIIDNGISNGTATGITGSFNGKCEIGRNTIVNAYGVDQDAIYATAHAIKDYGKFEPNIHDNTIEHCSRNAIRVVDPNKFTTPGSIINNTWIDSKGIVDESGSRQAGNGEVKPPSDPPAPVCPYPVAVVMSDGTQKSVAK